MNNDTFRILDEEHLLIFASANINTPISATQRYISLRSTVPRLLPFQNMPVLFLFTCAKNL